jgi:hypothetical protein
MIATGTSNRGTSPHRPLQDQHARRPFKITFGTRCSSTAVTPLPWAAGRPQPGVAGPDRGGRDRPRRRLSQTITVALPNAAISVDPFHLVQQAKLMVASVRKHDLDVRHRHRRHKGGAESSAIVGCSTPTDCRPTNPRIVADISDPCRGRRRGLDRHWPGGLRPHHAVRLIGRRRRCRQAGSTPWCHPCAPKPARPA